MMRQKRGHSLIVYNWMQRGLRSLPLWLTVFLLVTAGLSWAADAGDLLPAGLVQAVDVISTFSVIFLGIFIEAVPYLLMGTLASGLVEVFFNRDELACFLPQRRFSGALAGGLLGLFFPVCECGTVPLARRLILKGLPVWVGVTFLLAAPVLNPIVIASTLAAFGVGPIFWGRIGLTLAIAVATGFIFSLHPEPTRLLRPELQAESFLAHCDENSTVSASDRPAVTERLRRAALIAGDEFFELGRFLVLGALLAALMQALIQQKALLALNQGVLLPVLVMAALAVLLSSGSTVDAFIALAFAGAFASGSLLVFLVFGPMVDLKSVLLYLRVFNRRTVLYLALLPLIMTVVAAVAVNLFGTW
jgi:uncharacterized membrane protein YraQ (UPF0718 family)